MQQDHVLKKLNFDLVPRVQGVVGWVGVCMQNIWYYVAVFVIPFSLICNMAMFWKIRILTFCPHPLAGKGVCRQNICYHVAAFLIPFNLICKITIFWKFWILTFYPYPALGRVCGQNICYHVAAFVIPFNLICNMTMFWKNEFWPFDPRVGGRGLRTKYWLPCWCIRDFLECGCIRDSIWFYMQDAYVLDKLKFDLLNPRVDEGSGGKIFATMVLHSWFYLI